MNVKKNEFLESLSRVMPGVATGTPVLEGADNLIFHNGNVYSYNSTVSVMTPVGQDLNLEGAVKADDFFKCLQKLPDDFEVETSDKSWTLKCEKIKVKINLLNDIKSIFDRFEQLQPDENNWTDIVDNEIFNGLSLCNITSNDTQYAGVFIRGNTIVGSNGLQIIKYDCKGTYDNSWLSINGVNEILKWSDFNKIQLNRTWLQLTNGSVVFSVKTMFNQNIDKIVDKILGGFDNIKDFKTILEGSFTQETYDAIDRATSFSESVMNKDAVILTFKDEELIINAKRNSGEFSESVNIGTSVDTPMVFALELSMIKNISKFYKDFKVIDVPDKAPRMLFKNDKSVHLIATLKM